MVRIKGANSDYVYDSSTDKIVETKNQPVYLKIFVCPYDQPSDVEQNDGNVCAGIDEQCPHVGDKHGHALICLHETEGISLVSKQNITAKGNLIVEPTTDTPVLKVEKNQIDIKVPVQLSIESANGNQVSVNISTQGVSLQVGRNAKIQINSQGDIDLSTHNNSGQVKIHGNLEVTGDVTVAGKKLPRN
jgi:beta-xylosidase